MLTYKPHAKQAAAHKAFLVDGYDRGTLFWGRQVGKSLWSVKHLELAACVKQGQYFIVFNTHKHAKDVMWKQYLHTIPKELIYDTNATDMVITFNYIKAPIYMPGVGWIAVKHDVDKPRSTIQLLGSDYADDHRGRYADGIIFDEYQDQDPNNWESVYKYFFTTTKGWACFMGTAKGYNHWYHTLEYAKQEDNKRWFYLEATWRDNPLVDPAWIAQERKEAEERGELDTFMQEVELQFRTIQGAVYPSFDRRLHVITPSGKRDDGSIIVVPDEGILYGTWDFGWTEGHPTAFNLILIDGQGRRFVIDEIHGTEIEMDDVIEMIRMKVGDRRLVGIVGDSARPDLIAYARSKGLPMIEAPKKQGSVVAGITLLKQKLKPKIQILGLPEPEYYFLSTCKHTIYQFENYKYKENKPDRPASELPMKQDDDHPDGIRYLELYLKYGVVQKQEPIRSTLKFNQYGL
jgi:phage terminase large subunit